MRSADDDRAARELRQSDGVGVPARRRSAEEVGARRGIRFRRGSKLPTGRPDIAMVGVVNLDEEPASESKPARTTKAAKAPRKKTAKPAAEMAGVAEAAPPRKKGSGGRAKKKSE